MEVVGEKYFFPIAIALFGIQRIFKPKGELASPAAATEDPILYSMSTASSTSIEDVALLVIFDARTFSLA